jgi:ribosome-binding protein aMBF1 (putative translation factor)
MRGISQLNLSHRAGINQTVLSLLENDWRQPTKEQKRKLSRLLEVNPEVLFPMKQESKKKS